MAQFVPLTFPQILQRLINRVVARTALSDLTDSSVFKHILAGVAREIDDVYFATEKLFDHFSIFRASGEELDERAKDYAPDGTLERIAAVAATGNLVFTRVAPSGVPTPVPIGTQVDVPGESPAIVAVTTAAGTIPASAGANATSGNVPAVILDVGTRGNVAANVLTAFKGGKPTNVDSVTNPSAFFGGADQESDDTFRARIVAFTRAISRATPQALEFAALGVESGGAVVVFSHVVESIVQFGLATLYIDDGTGSAETSAAIVGENLTSGPEFPGDVAQGGETKLFTDEKPLKDEITPVFTKNPGAIVLIRDDPGAAGYSLNPASGQLVLNTALVAGDDVSGDYTHFTGLIQAVQKVIDGDPADRANFPGWRAGGVLIKVRTPSVLNVSITINITVLDGFSLTTVAENVRTVIASYVNALGIGNDVILAEIIERSMGVEGMFDAQVLSPVSNVVVLEDQLPRVNDAATDITVS